jgi:putative hydrolase of the HAD superfamily
MPIRAVIFDYGEVLCVPDPAAHRRLLQLTGLGHDAFEPLYWRDRRDYDLGLLDGPRYWAQFARDAGLSFTPAQIEALIENDVLTWTANLNEPMLAWAAALQNAGLLTAILSNMGPDVLCTMRQEFAWLAHFNQLIWSCELGIAKPDPAIYSLTCERLGVPLSEALFIDDKEENIRAAEQLGLHALQFLGITQLRRDLAARGLLQDYPQPGGSGPKDDGIDVLLSVL